MEDGIRTRSRFYPRQAKKESCDICLDENIDPDLMFSVDNCCHRFCKNCVKRHIEVKLLDGTIPNCLRYRCKSQLSIERCGKLVTRRLSFMWKERIKEESTPMRERVYCPYRGCSYLMSKKELFVYTYKESGLRVCFRCGGSFCVHCNVPWHSRLSCTFYKKLRPNHRNDDAKLKSLASIKGWRQCPKCQHMVERSSGCARIKCRCQYVFCYTCGSQWDRNTHKKDCSSRYEHAYDELLLVMLGGLLFIILLVILRQLLFSS